MFVRFRRARVCAFALGAALASLASGCASHAAAPVPAPVSQSKTLPTGFPAHAQMQFNHPAARAMDALHLPSTSPGSVPVAPMRSITVPGSWIQAHQPRTVHPQIIENGPSWATLSVPAVAIALSPDGSLFVLAAYGNGPDYPLLRYVNGAWKTLTGAGTHLAVSNDSSTLYVVNAEGGIWSYAIAAKQWTPIAGGASDIAAAKDGSIYVLSNGGESQGNFPIWHYANSAWSLIPGAGAHLIGSFDPGTYTASGGSIEPNGFYVWTSAGTIFYYDPGNPGTWAYLQGAAQGLAPVTGGLLALASGSPGSIYYYEYSSGAWTVFPGSGTVIAGSTSAIYVTAAGTGTIYTSPLTVKNVSQTEFPVSTPSGYFQDIVEGADGNLWFTDYDNDQIDRMTPAGKVTQFTTPTSGSGVEGITAGPDGNIWFTESFAANIGRITTAGVITEFPLPDQNSAPQGITAGPDGNLWFTDQGDVFAVGKISTQGKNVVEYPLSDQNSSFPQTITTGPDKNLWFTETGDDRIGVTTTSGSISEYTTPTSGSGPWGIASGPDGNLWFAENYAGNMGSITTGGSITEYPIPSQNAEPNEVALGPDGALWFADGGSPDGSAIGRITTAGVITEYATPTSQSSPYGITLGPGNALWYTETNNASSNLLNVGSLILQ